MKRIEDDHDFRERVCAWLRANDVEPDRTPVDCDPTIADGRLTIRQWVTGPDGNHGRVIDPADPNRLLTETITVPVLVEPDEDIAAWLRPGCPTCGR